MKKNWIYDIHPVQGFHVSRCDVCPLWLLKGMSTQNFLANLRLFLGRPLEQIDQSVPVRAVKSKSILSAGHRHFVHLLTQLYSRQIVNLHHLINATECRLSLTRYQVRANAKAIDFVILNKKKVQKKIFLSNELQKLTSKNVFLAIRNSYNDLFVQTQNSVLVDVVGRDDCQMCEPWNIVLLCECLEYLPRRATEICQISAVNSHSHGFIAQFVESKCHSAKVE